MLAKVRNGGEAGAGGLARLAEQVGERVHGATEPTQDVDRALARGERLTEDCGEPGRGGIGGQAEVLDRVLAIALERGDDGEHAALGLRPLSLEERVDTLSAWTVLGRVADLRELLLRDDALDLRDLLEASHQLLGLLLLLGQHAVQLVHGPRELLRLAAVERAQEVLVRVPGLLYGAFKVLHRTKRRDDLLPRLLDLRGLRLLVLPGRKQARQPSDERADTYPYRIPSRGHAARERAATGTGGEPGAAVAE